MAVSAKLPIIGLTAYLEPARWREWDRAAAFIPQAYVDGVVGGGGVPVLLPVLSPSGAAEAVGAIDGLVLSGGADVDPVHYDEQPLASTETCPDRDAFELAALSAALLRGVPVLAICRGMQLLNVACGGTLYQHLPDELGHDGHRPAPAEHGSTKVLIEPASRLAGILGNDAVVHCYHHQAVRRLGDGLVPVGWADDGTVEAVEHTGRGFVLGVQWHPEENAADRRLFEALTCAAAAVRQEGSA